MSFELSLSVLMLLYLPISTTLIMNVSFRIVYASVYGLVIFYFYLSAGTNPGRTVTQIDGSFENCDFCAAPKPERSHHCKRCRCCVLKMDHHCTWLNNCIGFYNICHFSRLLVYACLLSIWTLIQTLHSIADTSADHSLLIVLMHCINLVILVPFTSLICMMAWNQFLSVCTNMTTIERMTYDSNYAFEDLIFNPYDLGIKHNLNESLGHWLVGWILPLGPRGYGSFFSKKLEK